MKNTNRSLAVLAVFIIIVVALVLWYRAQYPKQTPVVTPGAGTLVLDQSVSDGTITIAYPSKDYGFATNPEQVLVHSYIPPCSENFDYCLYYNGSSYAGTNFESAGLRIGKRSDLSTEALCVKTPPSGYDAGVMPDWTTTRDAYSASTFKVGDAGAGHYANGALYRLYYRASNTCYEFETRIGETQYANYPAGSIKQFSDVDRVAVQADLAQIISSIKIPNGTKNLWVQ